MTDESPTWSLADAASRCRLSAQANLCEACVPHARATYVRGCVGDAPGRDRASRSAQRRRGWRRRFARGKSRNYPPEEVARSYRPVPHDGGSAVQVVATGELLT